LETITIYRDNFKYKLLLSTDWLVQLMQAITNIYNIFISQRRWDCFM